MKWDSESLLPDEQKKKVEVRMAEFAAKNKTPEELLMDLALASLIIDLQGSIIDSYKRELNGRIEERKEILAHSGEAEELAREAFRRFELRDDEVVKLKAELTDAPSKIKRDMAQNGAKAKDEKLEPVREFALNLANDGSYPSRRQAVLAIKTRVIDYAHAIEGVSMSEQQAERTIDGWLKKSDYTPSAGKRGMSASKHPTSASRRDMNVKDE